MHTDQSRQDGKREPFLVVLPVHNEGAGSIEDVRRRRAAGGIPNSVRLRRDPQLRGERSLRERQRLPATAEGPLCHGTTTLPSAGRTSQGGWRQAYFSQLICAADRSFLGDACLLIPPTSAAEPGQRPGFRGENGTPGRARTCDPRLRRPDVGSVIPRRLYSGAVLFEPKARNWPEFAHLSPFRTVT